MLAILMGLTMLFSGTGLALCAFGAKSVSNDGYDIEDVEIFFKPDPMNARSNGKFVTVHFEFPSEHDIEDIVVSSIRLDGFLEPEKVKGKTLKIGDHDDDEIPDIMLKFDRQKIIDHYGICEDHKVYFTGSLGDLDFIGTTEITIFDNRPRDGGWNQIYGTDFSSDPLWETNNPSCYYWDKDSGTYSAMMRDRSNEYARKAVPYNYGSFRFEYDFYADSINWKGDFHLGLRASSMKGYGNLDQTVELSIGVGSSGKEIAFCVIDKDMKRTYLREYPTQSWTFDEWYHVEIEYDAVTSTAVCIMTKRSDGTIMFQRTITDIGGFDDLTYIAASKIGDNYSLFGRGIGDFDNVYLYEPI